MSFSIEYLNRLEDELRKAAVARPVRRPFPPRTTAPRVLIAAALAVLTGGSLAVAVGGRVLTAFEGGPVPEHVISEFQRFARSPGPRDGAPPVPKGFLLGKLVPGSVHRVLTVRTARGKVAALYIARTTTGNMCSLSTGGPFGGGTCSGSTPAHRPFVNLITGGTLPDPTGKVQVKGSLTITGRATSAQAAIVRVAYADGTHHDIALVDGWFMFEVPAAHSTRASAPVRLDVLSAGGAHLGSLAHPFPPRPFSFHPAEPNVTDVKLLHSAALPNDGGTVKIWSSRDTAGHTCFRYLRNGRSQRSPAWDCSAPVGEYGYAPAAPAGTKVRHVPVEWQMGLANHWDQPVGYGYAYAVGWVAPEVGSLTLRFQDGSSTGIPLHDRFYLYVVPPANWPAGHRPSILEARDAQGALVYRQFLYPRQHCIYPGRDSLCRNQDMGTG